jgi:acetyltransferase-like isoleucine patch superfamily enzyme
MEIPNNVKIGENPIIHQYVILGLGDFDNLQIGDNATIRSHSIIYSGNKIGNNLKVGHHVLIREKNQIGNNVSIGSFTNIEHQTIIEDNVRIHSKAFIPEFTIIKNGAWIGPNVTITNSNYPNAKQSKNNLRKTTINENAKIGANSTILPGITIGKNSLIGAGSVVTKNIPENQVVAGNPAKVIKDINDLKWENNEKVY